MGWLKWPEMGKKNLINKKRRGHWWPNSNFQVSLTEDAMPVETRIVLHPFENITLIGKTTTDGSCEFKAWASRTLITSGAPMLEFQPAICAGCWLNLGTYHHSFIRLFCLLRILASASSPSCEVKHSLSRHWGVVIISNVNRCQTR